MRLPQSLQGRIALGLGVGVTALWLVAGVITGLMLQSEMNEISDAVLEETAQRLLPLAVIDIVNRDEEGVAQDIARLREEDELLTYLVRDDQGRVLIRSHAAKDSDFPAFGAVGFSQTDHHRLYSDAALKGAITIVVAEPLAHRAEIMRHLLMVLALPLLVLIPASLLGGNWIVRRNLAPLRQVSSSLAHRGGGNLTPLSDRNLPSEIKPISGAVNALLARIQRTLEAERSFAANAAHELRTPVAAALAQTQRLIAETPAGAGRQRAEDIEASLKRLHRLAEKLMQLARAEGGRMRVAETSDIRPIVAMVATDASSLAKTEIKISLPPTAVMSDIDPDALAILTRNLLENAIRHGAAPVQLLLSARGLLVVENAGAVVEAQALAKLTARFQRGDSVAEGTGLGLAIVQAIATGANAQLVLASPAPGKLDGFAVSVQL
jgi:two-component system OmpR family sensor kinase